ncbi:hypothetical protein [Microbacterium sp. UFMG61]|uniref:hypothetical protein n=1 Tax=Microbacterium sp. UFMG61 TaxID=2745935 RepID=UPI00188EF2AC|nr:hypothetical protein [Microbacterium sp. UFMG61]
MTKIQKHTIELRSPRTDAAETASEELARLHGQTERIHHAALNGDLSASELATHTDRVNLATLRADTTRAAADRELSELGKPNDIADAIAELLDDPTLSTAALQDAVTALRTALIALESANHDRNTAIVEWVQRLRGLGIPDTGLTVNDDEIRIQSGGTTGTTISVGPGRVATVPSVAGHVRHITEKLAAKAHMAIDPSNLDQADSRGRARVDTAAVRLITPIGGRAVGDVLTTRNHTLGVLAQMVHNGNAELIEGTIPEESEHQRTVFLGDTSLLPDPQRVTNLRNVHDDSDVASAVAKAFSN